MAFAIAFLVGTNVLLGKWFVWDPLQAARAGAASVRYSPEGVALTAFLPGIILLFIFTCCTWPNMHRRFPEKQLVPLLTAITFVVLGVLGMLGLFWFESQLAALGYPKK
jgi:phosphotransferase system  glucose/maltose/N-acetylglucosamine-specific IIC component